MVCYKLNFLFFYTWLYLAPSLIKSLCIVASPHNSKPCWIHRETSMPFTHVWHLLMLYSHGWTSTIRPFSWYDNSKNLMIAVVWHVLLICFNCVQAQDAAHKHHHGHPHMHLLHRPDAHPMIIQGLRANTKDPDAHVVFFDIEAMISKIFYKCLFIHRLLDSFCFPPIKSQRSRLWFGIIPICNFFSFSDIIEFSVI